MDKKNYSRSNNVEEESDNRQSRPTRRNTRKQHQETRSAASIKERRQTNMRTRQDHLYGRKDIYPKQQKTQGKDSTGKS